MNSNSSQVIHTPKNSSYSTLLNSFSDNLRITSDFKPSIIFTPTNESQIQVAIHCSKLHDLQIRIRSGGHDHEGLSYISETPFFIIDLRNLRSISIDTKKKTAWIQAGATIGELYYRIAEKSKKLAFPAGVCPTVGVGGHFSGGGYGMLARKFGTAADNIIDAKLIDANGQIKDRESMGEDHFWAIRGGGGTSFGLIISWKVKLHDIRKKVTVFNVTRTLEQNATQLIYKWQHIADKVDDNLLLRLFLKSNVQSPFKPGQRSIQAIFSTMFVGGVDELLHEMQKSFPELGLMKEDCIEMSWIESIIFFYGGFPNGTSPDALLNWNTTIFQLAYSYIPCTDASWPASFDDADSGTPDQHPARR
ncbi:hypothetical protein MTR67_008933 [Solanum verrucosum]|uniref:FAD-binding PCMH-type domain-containing protein n=1 Tax=Solanum verrucosum TaxID=315347 RepID=A0AAF0TGU8_SOLVR|nr:hypothetical protein MTR67_008933 [Solanum verrucosum]